MNDRNKKIILKEPGLFMDPSSIPLGEAGIPRR